MLSQATLDRAIRARTALQRATEEANAAVAAMLDELSPYELAPLRKRVGPV